MKLKRFIGFSLVLVLLISVLAGCKAAEPAVLVASAELALEEAPYTVNATVEYTSPDESMSAIIKSFSNPTIKVAVDGERFRAQMDIKNGDTSNYIVYTYVDGFLYTQWQENGVTYTDKEEYTKEDKDALATSLGSGAGVGILDFENVSSKRDGKVDVISCDRIKAESLGSLISSLEEQLTSINATVEIKDAALTMEIQDGKYQSTVLTCEYYITTELDSYVINMTYTTEFDYESGVAISAPLF